MTLTQGSLLAATDDSSNPWLELFEQYWSVPSLETYQQLFREGEAPELSQEAFAQWKEHVASNPPEVLAAFPYLDREGREAAAIHYRAGDALGNVFLAKQRAGKWYPFDQEENVQHRELQRLVATFKPAAYFLVSDFPDASDEAREIREQHGELAAQFRETVSATSSDSLIDGKAMSANLQELFEHGDAAALEFAQAIGYDQNRTRVLKHSRPLTEEDRHAHQELLALLRARSYPTALADMILHDILVGAPLSAAKRMQEFEGTPSVHEHVMIIREIYGDDAVRVWDSRAQE